MLPMRSIASCVFMSPHQMPQSLTQIVFITTYASYNNCQQKLNGIRKGVDWSGGVADRPQLRERPDEVSIPDASQKGGTEIVSSLDQGKASVYEGLARWRVPVWPLWRCYSTGNRTTRT